MYFYKELKKREYALTKQLADWCMDDYNCFIQKFLLGDDYFESSVYLDNTEDEYKRPLIRNYSYIETDHAKRHLFTFAKVEDSFLFDDEKTEAKINGNDVIIKIHEKNCMNWFVWIIPANCYYKDELQKYVDSSNTENIRTKIIFWEDLLDEYAKSRKNCAAEKEVKLTYKLLSQEVSSIKDYYPAEDEIKEILITANDFNSSYCKQNRCPDKQAILELTFKGDEPDLDSSVADKINKRIDEITKAEKILLVLDDDNEGNALKDSIIKYFRSEHPEIITEQRLECISFPKYFIEPNEISDGEYVDSIEGLEKVFAEWNTNSSGKIFTVKKGITSLEEMGSYAEVYLNAVINYQKHRKIIK